MISELLRGLGIYQDPKHRLEQMKTTLNLLLQLNDGNTPTHILSILNSNVYTEAKRIEHIAHHLCLVNSDIAQVIVVT